MCAPWNRERLICRESLVAGGRAFARFDGRTCAAADRGAGKHSHLASAVQCTLFMVYGVRLRCSAGAPLLSSGSEDSWQLQSVAHARISCVCRVGHHRLRPKHRFAAGSTQYSPPPTSHLPPPSSASPPAPGSSQSVPTTALGKRHSALAAGAATRASQRRVFAGRPRRLLTHPACTPGGAMLRLIYSDRNRQELTGTDSAGGATPSLIVPSAECWGGATPSL